LQDDFKGRFTKVSPAAVELHVTWDIFNSVPAAIQLAPDHVTEYKCLPDASNLKNFLFMGGRGYFKLAYFDDINAFHFRKIAGVNFACKVAT
jgi:hypothetical protein